jgi:hypothetical protein
MKLLEITNNTAQTVSNGNPLILGNISRRVGCFTDYSAPATTLTLRETGYYEIIFKVNAESTVATQPVEITLFLDGVAQPETLSEDVIAVIGDVSTLNTNKIIRVFGNSNSTISFVNTGADDTIYNNIVLDVKKVV